MPINSDGNVYGVCWNIYDSSENFIRRYEKVYSEPMNLRQVKEILEDFNKLSSVEKRYAKMRFFTYCTTKYVDGGGNFMCWVPEKKESLIAMSLTGHIRM
jgi:hypothetical protein